MPESSPTSSRSRRLPLTRAALVGSAIAIPLYMLSSSASVTPEAPRSEAEIAAMLPAPEPLHRMEAADPSAPSGETPHDAGPKGKDADASARPLADRSAAMWDAVPPKALPPAAPSPMERPTALPTEASSGGRPSSPMAELASAPSGLGASKRSARRGAADEGIAEYHAAHREEKADAEAPLKREFPIAAGQLTAGAINDLDHIELLNELRLRATQRDPSLASTVPDHKAKMPAPDGTSSQRLELGFVLDTTGSMDDEIRYLKAEIHSIAEEIGQEYPQVSQNFGLVVYKDAGDEYVVRQHDFAPLETFTDALGVESANGGGDFPEAMDQALQTASRLQWSNRGAAKLLFLIADAPPHAEGYQTFVQATGALARQQVSVYPVASSGVETTCEYLMRWSARTTGGQYLFLTDHSGIGNPHADPVVDQYELKPLRTHMLEMIRAELGRPQVLPVAQAVPPPPSPGVPTVAAPAPLSEPTWLERHGLFAAILGGIFLLGFAGDTTMETLRRARATRSPSS